MTDATNPLDTEEAREPTELEVLKERARKMGITFSNNIGVESLRQKIAEKQEGKGENYNPALPESVANPAVGAAPSLFSLGSIQGQAKVEPEQEKSAAEIAADATMSKEDVVKALQAQLTALTGVAMPVEPLAPAAAINPLSDNPAPVRQRTLQQMMREEQTKLVRIRIQNLDPKKKDLQGEIITVANEYLGTIKKFVPYGEVTDEGYHVPYCIYEFLKSKRFLNIRTTRDRVTKQIKVEHSMTLEYSIELLPQLTKEDLNRLAASQAAAGSLN